LRKELEEGHSEERQREQDEEKDSGARAEGGLIEEKGRGNEEEDFLVHTWLREGKW
jgi:hypothetical protein